uniref:Uncharacterized protein n=1 Tax=Lepeophtheirus salmonis TaxID=72036 RepID=A0A0K2TMC0_LEPSM
MFNFNKMALPATQATKQSFFYRKSFRTVLSLKDGIREAIEDIQRPLWDLGMENFIKTIQSC